MGRYGSVAPGRQLSLEPIGQLTRVGADIREPELFDVLQRRVRAQRQRVRERARFVARGARQRLPRDVDAIELRDLPVTVARAANIYGPGDINLSRIIPGTILSVLKGEDPIVRSDGTPVREYIHVSDVVTGYLRLLEEIDATRGEAYNIGSGDHFDVLSLVGKIIEACGASGRSKPVVMLQKKIEREIDQQYLSSEKMHQATGWRAENRLEDGLTGTIAWYRENQHRLA